MSGNLLKKKIRTLIKYNNLAYNDVFEGYTMRLIETFFALVGLFAVLMASAFYIGYTTVHPPCNSALAIFTKECK